MIYKIHIKIIYSGDLSNADENRKEDFYIATNIDPNKNTRNAKTLYTSNTTIGHTYTLPFIMRNQKPEARIHRLFD